MTPKSRALAAVAVLVAVTAAGVAVAISGSERATPATEDPPPNTATVERGKLSDMVSQYGVIAFRARSDGSPYAAINQARGTYTELPDVGDQVDCGDALYRVDEIAVLLLCGTVPAYRPMQGGDVGEDVHQLNQNLHALGYDAGFPLDPDGDTFTAQTAKALEGLEHDKGLDATGGLQLGHAVFLPEPVRIAGVSGLLGGPAQPGTEVLDATSDTPQVQVALDPSQQDEVKAGDRVQVRLPGSTVASGTVDRLGKVAQVPAGQNANAQAVSIPAYIRLDQPDAARGFDGAPVQVDITTEGVENALSVPVAALVGKSGGGFAVEVVRANGSHDLVAVKLGLFDTADGRVEVKGDLVPGDQVVVPAV